MAVVLFLFLPTVVARADCIAENLDLRRFHPRDPRYAPLAFAYCARVRRECPTALGQLEQVRSLDPSIHDYLVGVALGAGECFRRSPEQAERHLQSCARYSQACKKALLLLATLNPGNLKKYWPLANEIVRTGSVYGMLYLMEYHASLNTAHDREQALYWLEIARVGSGNAVARLRRQAERGQYDKGQLARLQNQQQRFMARLDQRAAPILQKLDQTAIARARANAATWHRRNAAFFRRQQQANDPVAWIASIYNLNFALLRPVGSLPANPPVKAPESQPGKDPDKAPAKRAQPEKQNKKDRPDAKPPAPARENQPEKLREYEKIIDDLVM